MKKSLSVTLCIAASFVAVMCLSSCGSSESTYIVPEISTPVENITIEGITNLENDFSFPIEGLKFEHSRLEEGELQYGWVIYENNRDLIGWFENVGSGFGNDNGKWKYGYTPTYNNDVYGFYSSPFTLFMKGKDAAIFEKITFTTNHGEIKRNLEKCGTASDIYNSGVDENQEYIPLKGAEDFVYCEYMYSFDGVKTNDVKDIKIVMSISN